MSGNVIFEKDNNALQKTLWALTLICGILVTVLYQVVHMENTDLYIVSLKIIISVIATMMLLAIIMGVTLWRLRKTMQGSASFKMLYRMLHLLYPFLYALGKMLRMKKDEIRRSYISINNQLVHLLFHKFNTSEALILTPHCLQNSDCNVKVTGNSNHCKRCGKCDIQTLVELSEKYAIPLVVATGGTLARKAIEDRRPKVIFAVACERDLAAGIYDIQTIPVVGVLNNRPNGPCYNTTIDVNAIEKEIADLIEDETSSELPKKRIDF